MPYTTHGHWYGPGDPTEPYPMVAKCGGPGICRQCHTEALHEPGAPSSVTIHTDGPAIVYASADRAVHQIDADGWDPAGMSLRERRLCRALLTHALEKLDLLDKAEQMGLIVGKQGTDRG